MFRRIMDSLGYVQTWLWIWGVVSTSTVGVVIWVLIARLPSVTVLVLALGTGVLTLIGLETALVIHEKVKELLVKRCGRAVIALGGLRPIGDVLRKRPVTSEAELRAFITDVTAFQAEALAAMQGAAPRTDIAWFRDLHEWAVAHDVSAYNDEHAILRAALEEKLRRMDQIAGRLEATIK